MLKGKFMNDMYNYSIKEVIC